MMAMDARGAVDFILSGGQCHDAPQGQLLMETVGPLQAAQRDREAVPPYAGFPPHFLQVRKTERDVHGVYTAGLGLCLN